MEINILIVFPKLLSRWRVFHVADGAWLPGLHQQNRWRTELHSLDQRHHRTPLQRLDVDDTARPSCAQPRRQQLSQPLVGPGQALVLRAVTARASVLGVLRRGQAAKNLQHGWVGVIVSVSPFYFHPTTLKSTLFGAILGTVSKPLLFVCSISQIIAFPAQM